jgi:hypothetical protein
MNERSFIVNRHLRATVGSNRSAIPLAKFCCLPRPCGPRRSRAKVAGPSRRSYLTGHRQVATTAAEILLRFRIDHRFHGVMRHNGHRLRWRLEASKRIWRRLRDELHDRGDHAQNARGVNRRFHYAPAFLLRVYQEPVDRLSFVLHNIETPRSSRFV